MNDVNTIDDLMKYMDENIKYGWLGIDGKVRIDSLKDFKDYYRTMNIDDVIKCGVGLCPDQVNFIKNFFDSKNIQNKIFVIVGYENVLGIDKERVHFMIFYENDNTWYQFEHASRFFKGIFKYGSLSDTKNKVLDKYKEILKNAKLFEIDGIPVGIGYDELRNLIIKKLYEKKS